MFAGGSPHSGVGWGVSRYDVRLRLQVGGFSGEVMGERFKVLGFGGSSGFRC